MSVVTTGTDKAERLPRWARQRIAVLESDLRTVTAERDAVPSGAAELPRIEIGTATLAAPDGYLPASSRVVFRFGARDFQRFAVHLEGEILHVSGGAVLLIEPRASNVIHCESAGFGRRRP